MGINRAGLSLMQDWNLYEPNLPLAFIWVHGMGIERFMECVESGMKAPRDCQLLIYGGRVKSFDRRLGARIVSAPCPSCDPLLSAMSYAIEFLRFGRVIAISEAQHSYYEWRGAIAQRRNNNKGISFARRRIFFYPSVPAPLNRGKGIFDAWSKQ